MSGQLGGLKDEWPTLEPVRFGQSCPDRLECRQPNGCPCRQMGASGNSAGSADKKVANSGLSFLKRRRQPLFTPR